MAYDSYAASSCIMSNPTPCGMRDAAACRAGRRAMGQTVEAAVILMARRPLGRPVALPVSAQCAVWARGDLARMLRFADCRPCPTSFRGHRHSN
mmetsp:Transcript_19726/g.44049  ORF Transcript_19726/g.44049 Transcript_19726/m.44049 type:complete len:94 (+) Transcript_19726:168-449(+)